MHETAIAEGIIKEAERQGEVEEVVLELGELGHVPPHELVATLERLRPEWAFTWEETPAKARCVCGFEGRPQVLERGHDFFMIECPKCGEVPDLLEGEDFKIISVRVK